MLRRLGGTARRWRVDRMATVVVPGADRIRPSFVGVAKHYGVGVDPCPPRHPQRKGVVEKAIHYVSQRWWRTAMVNSLAQAQDSLDDFCVSVGDSTAGDLADTEPLLKLPPMPYAAEGSLVRRVATNGVGVGVGKSLFGATWGDRNPGDHPLASGRLHHRHSLGIGTVGGDPSEGTPQPSPLAFHEPKRLLGVDPVSSANQAAAFARISFSSRRIRFSRRNLPSSSRSRVVKPSL